MKTITVEKNLYDFKEVKEKALEKNRYCRINDDLTSEHEYLTSDEVVSEWLSDGFYFNEEGTIYDTK